MRLLGDPTLYVGANCTTESILACDQPQVASTAVVAVVTTNTNNSTIIAKESTAPNQQENRVAQKEKELFYSLIPVAAMAFKSDYDASDEKAVDSLMNKLDTYVQQSNDVSPILKPFMKLAQISTQMNLAEAGHGSKGADNNSLLSDLSSSLAAPAGGSKGLTLGGKRLSDMSHTQISQSLEPFKDDFNTLLFGETDEFAHDKPTRKYIAKLEAGIIEINSQLKIKYGYDIHDMRLAIRNFDNNLFDKIIASGFPDNTKIRFAKADNGLEYSYMFWGVPDIAQDLEKPIHYAARHGNAYALKQLIEKGSKVNEIVGQKGYETTPLFLALSGSHYEATKVLLEAGADPFISLKDKYFNYSASNPNPYQSALKKKLFAELLKQFHK